MSAKASITVLLPPDEAQRLWTGAEHPHVDGAGGTVSFRPAPGDRGTEIHVDLEKSAPGGRLGEVVQKVVGAAPLAKVKDDLRRFKQRVETGEIPRSDGTPEGELAERKLKQRPAQPLTDAEREKVLA